MSNVKNLHKLTKKQLIEQILFLQSTLKKYKRFLGDLKVVKKQEIKVEDWILEAYSE